MGSAWGLLSNEVGKSRTRAMAGEAPQGPGPAVLGVTGHSGGEGGSVSRIPSLSSWGQWSVAALGESVVLSPLGLRSKPSTWKAPLLRAIS